MCQENPVWSTDHRLGQGKFDPHLRLPFEKSPLAIVRMDRKNPQPPLSKIPVSEEPMITYVCIYNNVEQLTQMLLPSLGVNPYVKPGFAFSPSGLIPCQNGNLLLIDNRGGHIHLQQGI